MFTALSVAPVAFVAAIVTTNPLIAALASVLVPARRAHYNAHGGRRNRYRADAGLDHAFRQAAVAHQARPTGRIAFVGMPSQELGHLRFNRLRQQRPGSLSKHFGQRVLNLVRHCRILKDKNIIVTHDPFTSAQKNL
ncbi:MAG: hypothetical protein IT521_04350 [Burkholderiales bacterium]|nr:hypothetical protein [Burkholderiales bacterium]